MSCVDDSVMPIKLRVTDTHGATGTAGTTMTVLNVAPTVGLLTVLSNPVSLGTPITVSAAFSDQGTNDTHTAVLVWDDGMDSAGTIIEASGSGTASGSHTYTAAGVYTIRLSITDDDGGTGTSEAAEYVVIYDPSGGFVTGGGWINSPSGAYPADPSLTGRANFGFVSKYKKGATVPTGNTEFQFQVANLNFHSESYDWLVIAGAKAQYKGTGAINGAGSYGFMLTAIDGQINGGGGVDKFRIKIWDKATDTIIYDNMLSASDDSTPTTVIGGGSIVIHKK